MRLSLHYMSKINTTTDLFPKSKFNYLIHIYFYRREIIIGLLIKRYADKMKTNLKMYDIPEKNLKGFTTTEKDSKRGTDRYPPDNFRNFKLDLIKEETPS